MAKVYKSDVGYFRDDEGERDDISFHREILINKKASKILAEKSFQIAIEKFKIDPAIAEEMFLT